MYFLAELFAYIRKMLYLCSGFVKYTHGNPKKHFGNYR